MHLLRRARRSIGWSQVYLARRSGVSEKTISNIEQGRYQSRMPTRRKLLWALRIPLEKHHDIFGPLP